MTFVLRQYQRAAVDALFRYFKEGGTGSPLATLPTGAGKTLVIAEFVRQALTRYPSERLMLVSHVRELLVQDATKLLEHWPDADVGMYSAGLKGRNTDSQIVVAGIQSCYSKAHEFGPRSLVLIDEAHLVPKKGLGMYRRFLGELRTYNPHLKEIGVTATAYRLDSGMLHKGEGAIFTDIVYEADITELIRDGYLCPLISRLGASRASMDGVTVRGGEYVAKELQAAVDTGALVSGAVDEIVNLCADRNKWLIFCAGVEHSYHVRDELRARGVTCETVIGDIEEAERDRILGDFKAGRIRAVTNMGVLTTGFDAPDIDAVILMRPTLSPGLYCQMVGRALRTHHSKDNSLVLDFAGNILRHGPIDQIRVTDKRNGETEVKTAPMKECPECGQLCFVAIRECACGYQFPIDDSPKHSTKPTEADILSTATPESVEVDSVSYAIHEKEGSPNSLRVTYQCGLLQYREWICVEHTGYARQKAERWWVLRHKSACPRLASEAVDVGRRGELAEPTVIVVSTVGKYPKIVSHWNLKPREAACEVAV